MTTYTDSQVTSEHRLQCPKCKQFFTAIRVPEKSQHVWKYVHRAGGHWVEHQCERQVK